MKAEHRGFETTGMTGNISADIQDDGTYTQIKLEGVGDCRSFDLAGLSALIDDLQEVRRLAEQVDRFNTPNREPSE